MSRQRGLIEGPFHFKAGDAEGVGPDNSCLKYSHVSPVTLADGERMTVGAPNKEIAVVLILGEIQFEGAAIGSGKLGPRESFIKERAHALYVAPGDTFELCATLASELFIVSAAVDPAPDLVSRWVRPEDQSPKQVGQNNWYREVTPIIDGDFPARVLVLGETVNSPGNWSSSPPHKHDGEHGESCLEESYYYRLDPPQGFGVQMLYTTDGEIDEAMTVRDGDIVTIPKGYHPVAAGPGYHLYYLWVLAGEGRALKWYEDPQHKWINEA